MRIAVIEHVQSGAYAEYIYSLIDEKAKELNYLVKAWSNTVPAFQQQIEDNTIIYINIQRESNFSLKWLYNVKIPSILKKTRAEIVIDLNGIASSKIKLSQTIITEQFLYNDNDLSGMQKFATKNFKESVSAAKNVLSYSKHNLDKANINLNNLQYLPFTSPSNFRTYEWHDKLMIKANYADNKEYFLAVIGDESVDDFVLLLQAFTKFKKWQQSSMQLLILPKYESFSSAIIEKHKTYKYREDVRLLQDDVEEREISPIFSSAYALLHAETKAPDLLTIATALQCSLPIISFNDIYVKEYAGDACLYCAEKDAVDYGNTILKLYKDENLHAQMKEHAQKQSSLLNRKDTVDKLWKLCEDAKQSL